MNVKDQIKGYIDSQPGSKQDEMQALHNLILDQQPTCKLWFLDGKNSEGKVVSNPNIGYGSFTKKYANGKSEEVFQLSISGNQTGISLYIMGIEDKSYLASNFGKTLGKASVTGYCIKFKSLKDIDLKILRDVIDYGFQAQN